MALSRADFPRVHDLGFLIDKLGKDAGPLQFLRELTISGLRPT